MSEVRGGEGMTPKSNERPLRAARYYGPLLVSGEMVSLHSDGPTLAPSLRPPAEPIRCSQGTHWNLALSVLSPGCTKEHRSLLNPSVAAENTIALDKVSRKVHSVVGEFVWCSFQTSTHTESPVPSKGKSLRQHHPLRYEASGNAAEATHAGGLAWNAGRLYWNALNGLEHFVTLDLKVSEQGKTAEEGTCPRG